MAILGSNPRHWLDIVLWPILRVLWEPFSRKQSHWWHWRRVDNRVMIRAHSSIVVPRHSTSREGRSFWGNFFQRNFGWKHVAILTPSNPKYRYRIGFYRRGHFHERQLCSIILRGPCAVLIGDEDINFFAVDAYGGDQLELDLFWATCPKKRLPKNVTLI